MEDKIKQLKQLQEELINDIINSDLTTIEKIKYLTEHSGWNKHSWSPLEEYSSLALRHGGCVLLHEYPVKGHIKHLIAEEDFVLYLRAGLKDFKLKIPEEQHNKMLLDYMIKNKTVYYEIDY